MIRLSKTRVFALKKSNFKTWNRITEGENSIWSFLCGFLVPIYAPYSPHFLWHHSPAFYVSTWFMTKCFAVLHYAAKMMFFLRYVMFDIAKLFWIMFTFKKLDINRHLTWNESTDIDHNVLLLVNQHYSIPKWLKIVLRSA